MKKLIITLAIAALNVHATDCIQALFNIYSMKFQAYEADYDGLVLDSVYSFTKDHATETKYYYTNSNNFYYIDYKYSPDTKNYSVLNSDTTNRSVAISQDGDFKKYIVTQEYNRYPNHYTTNDVYRVFQTKDSIYFELSYLQENSDFYVYNRYIRNDTLYSASVSTYATPTDPETPARSPKKFLNAITRDPANESKCYDVLIEESATYLQHIDVFETHGDTLLQKTYQKEEVSDSYYSINYYVPLKKSTSSIVRRDHPTFKLQKTKPFDLLGRPAKNEHSVRVLK